MDELESAQRDHYNEILDAYTRSYGDSWSQAYRNQFIDSAMFAGLPLAGKKVLDAMCGSGETTGYLLSQNADVSGLDISDKSIEMFKSKWPTCDAHCTSILETGLEDNTYDCVTIVGGLHHVHPYVGDAVREIHRILKPNGTFCFMEPHRGSLPDVLRRLWYSFDPLFESNEEGIDLAFMKEEFSSEFVYRGEKHRGNLAYLLVFNSLIFRIPSRIKSIYSPLLLKLERLLDRIQTPALSCYAVCQWQKI